MRYFNFSVEEEFYKKVKIDAVLKGQTTKEYMRSAVELYLNHGKAPAKQKKNAATTTNPATF